jgi:hypothetical protein
MANLAQTERLCNGWLDSIRGNPFVIGQAALAFFTDLPGATGTSNASTVTTRTAVYFNDPDNAEMEMAGDPPEFPVTGAATLKYAGGFTGLAGDPDAWCWATGNVVVPVTVANGDVLKVASCTVKFREVAA